MYSKMVSLRFPEKTVNEPVVMNLVKKFDLSFNILKATIYPRKEGFVVMELAGHRKNYQRGLRYLKSLGIRFAGKALGRPKKVTQANQAALKHAQAKRREEYLRRIPIEGKFGQGKNGYRLNYIRAKRADTSVAWINSIFLVMNLLILLRIFFGLCKSLLAMPTLVRMWTKEMLRCDRQAPQLGEDDRFAILAT